MEIRGLKRFSLVDYPGKISCIIFLAHCNFRCAYCHNPHLVLDPESQPQIPEKQILSFLEQRKNKLEGVVISGGEPSIYNNLIHFAEKIRKIGFLIKLDTNGSNPGIITEMHKAGLIDFLSIDYKAHASLYRKVTACSTDAFEHIQESIRYALGSGISLEIRTTVHKQLLLPEDLQVMREELNSLGIKRWILQQFNPVDTIDDSLSCSPTYTDTELIKLAKNLGNTHVRGLKGTLIA